MPHYTHWDIIGVAMCLTLAAFTGYALVMSIRSALNHRK